MPTYPSVTYTFVNGNASDASQVNQNFTDIINGLSDGTKDIQVNDITANGNVVLGGSTADTVTFNALLGNATFNQASGDPQINFKIGGTQKFSMGVDDSDSDMFKLSTTADIGTTPAFKINSSAEFAFMRGLSTPASAAAGGIGEVIQTSFSRTSSVVGATWEELCDITLTPGVWKINGSGSFMQQGTAGYINNLKLNIFTASSTAVPGTRTIGVNEAPMTALNPPSGTNQWGCADITGYHVQPSTATTYFMKYYCDSVGNNGNAQLGAMRAERIA